MADERVVLTDDEGNYYVLSRDVIERAKVTGSEKKRLQAALESTGDTSGFAFEIISPNRTFPDQPLPTSGPGFKLIGIVRYDRPAASS
jgi:hypothetical protein